ncbi:MAG: Biopolymer transport protein ExbD [Candidatus Anoxychlamydiales bacterium]|nr:Biopolymer transport protein ExbD [Candidatus Anoxychlamydiales bacterium]
MRKRKLSNNSNHLEEDLINLTPLIDVVFVVLISFILIAPLLEADHVNLASSSITSTKNVESSKIIIKVKFDNSILLNNRPILLSELTSILKKNRNPNIKQIPQLYHDKKATFGTYQSIKNAVEASGFEELDVILMPH